MIAQSSIILYTLSIIISVSHVQKVCNLLMKKKNKINSVHYTWVSQADYYYCLSEHQKWKEFLFSIRHCIQMCRLAKSINHEYKLIGWRIEQNEEQEEKKPFHFYFIYTFAIFFSLHHFLPLLYFFFLTFLQYSFIVWCNHFKCHVINVMLFLLARGGLNHHNLLRNHLEMFKIFQQCVQCSWYFTCTIHLLQHDECALRQEIKRRTLCFSSWHDKLNSYRTCHSNACLRD